MWFDFEADTGAKVIAVPVDEYGNNDRIRQVDSSKTLLDVVAGDELFNYDSVLKLTKVAIFQATPAPVVTADKPVFEVLFGKSWFAETSDHAVKSVSVEVSRQPVIETSE